jgi:predicted ribosomally synthesized peptide with SipW-like signal peptide
MKKNKTEKNLKKDKRKLLIVSGISLLTILGGTLAYFTTSTDIVNLFKTALYQHTIVEEFVSPETWSPNTTTDQTITVTNNGNIGMALRASYTEKWVNGNGEELSLKDADGNVASIINFNDSWTKDSDGYYYYGSKAYMKELDPDETSTSFINSVTFNKNIKSILTSSVSNGGQTITYTSSGNGYDNAKYILTVTIDTIQYDLASEIW